MMYLVEMDGYNPLTSSVVTLYYASEAMLPFAPTDASRPNQYYEPRVKEFTGFTRSMYGSGRTSGKSSSGGGQLILDNADNALEAVHSWGFSGRRIRVFVGNNGNSFAQFTEILRGTLEQPDFTFATQSPGEVRVIMRDRLLELDKPIQSNRYLGTNSGATGNEGLPDDIQGNPKPLCFGECYNVQPVPVNTSALRYQVHDGAIEDVFACYDMGVALVKMAAPPTAGKYSVDVATGIITLGATPAGEVTCDVKGHKPGGVYLTKVADIMSAIVQTYGGISGAEVDTASITALNTLNSATVGIYLREETRIPAVLDELANAIAAYWSFSAIGKFTVGRISAPSGSPVLSLTDTDMIELERVQSNDDTGNIPAYAVELSYKKLFKTQADSALAGAVTVARRAFLADVYRTVYVADVSVLTVHLLAKKLSRNTLIVGSADATSEANRLLTLYKVRRDFLKVVIEFNAANAALKLGDLINLATGRLGLSAGKLFIITSFDLYKPLPSQIMLEVWG